LTAAQTALEKSLATLEALHSRYEAGQTLFQLARLYRALGRQADSTTALERAMAIFQELGARLDLEQAQRWAAAEMKTGS
jgi:flagellin-specific chaperone FliS